MAELQGADMVESMGVEAKEVTVDPVMSNKRDRTGEERYPARATGVGLTEREREYVNWYKKLIKDAVSEADCFRQIGEVMRISPKTAEQYRYSKPRVKAELEAWKDKTFDENGDLKEEILSLRVIMQKLQRLYNILEEKGNARISDMTDILKTLATLMTKFNTTYEDDLENIKHITTSELIHRWTKTFGKLVGNYRVSGMLERMLKTKEEKKDEVVEEPKEDVIEGKAAIHRALQVVAENAPVGEGDGETPGDPEPSGVRESDDPGQSYNQGDEDTFETNAKERAHPVDSDVRVSFSENV